MSTRNYNYLLVLEYRLGKIFRLKADTLREFVTVSGDVVTEL